MKSKPVASTVANVKPVKHKINYFKFSLVDMIDEGYIFLYSLSINPKPSHPEELRRFEREVKKALKNSTIENMLMKIFGMTYYAEGLIFSTKNVAPGQFHLPIEGVLYDVKYYRADV